MSSTRRPSSGASGDVVNEGLNYEVKEIPAEHLKKNAKAALAELIDAVSNKDDEIAGLVIEEKPVTPQRAQGRHSPADLQD